LKTTTPPVSPASMRRMTSLSLGRSTVPPETSSSLVDAGDAMAVGGGPRGDALALDGGAR
jgi:hypothetical protein